ncbi:MAG: fimbrillin family protein, partial [Bacteroidales bacterium]|nr:fimbrillin family protein [Bacteroidales bacterium]
YTDFEASVTKVTAPAIPNAGSASVSYAGDAVAVSYGTVGISGSFVTATPISTATALASGKTIDVLSMAVADAKGYQMVWPQTLAEDAVTITISYTLNGVAYTDKTVTLPADTWEAGKKYDYELQILPSDIHLIFTVQDWDSGEAGSIDTSDGSINMSNVTWMNTKLMVNDVLTNTVNNAGYSVTMYKDPKLADGTQYTGYYPAQGYFTVNYPKAGLFKIELIPAYGETTVDASKYEILIYDNTIANPDDPQEEQHPVGFRAIDPDGEDITNNTVYFRVAAAANQDGAQHKAQINILFKPDGSDEWISAYSEIRANYAVIIPATN